MYDRKEGAMELNPLEADKNTSDTPEAESQPNNPLHGVTLEKMLTYLVETIGWEELSFRINVRCFNIDPSIKSSLVFLRRTDWARKKVERLYLKKLQQPTRRKRENDRESLEDE